MELLYGTVLAMVVLMPVALFQTHFQTSMPSWKVLKVSQAKIDADTIIKAAFSSSSVYERLAYMTDTYGPRLSGSTALERALDWVKEMVEKDGINVREEKVKVPCWVRGHEYATLLSPRVKNLRMVGLGGSVGTPAGKPLVAKVLVVSSFEDLKRHGSEAKGRIVVFNAPFQDYETTVSYRTSGPEAAEKHGAVAALIRSIAPFGIQTVHTGETDTSGIPSAAISLEDAEMFARMQGRGQDVVIELYMEAHTLPDQFSRNLILEIEGNERPNEVVVFGGHMDSWDIADGAMDDGGGAFISWEVIRIIHNLNLKPKRTLRAVLFVNEENGARGGQQYFQDHEHELNLTSIAIESDAGTFTPHGISFQGSKAAQAILRDIGEELLATIGAGNITGSGGGTDISYMCDQGVPCAGLVVLDPRIGSSSNNPCGSFSKPPYPNIDFLKSAYFWYHHTEGDTIDKLNPQQLQHCAAALAVWTYSIANLNSLLPR